MTDKELHRLSRRELLQLLLTQAKDTEELRQLTEEQEEQLESLKNSYDHLKRRLDQKDIQIHELRTALHEERSNRRIELAEAGSIAEAALRLNGIFEMAQKAAEQYLYNVKMLHEKEDPQSEEFFEAPYLEMTESPEEDTIVPEEAENWIEKMPEPDVSEDMTEKEAEFPAEEWVEAGPEFPAEDWVETEPEFPEEYWSETEPGFPDEKIAEPETASPQEDMAEPETENQAEDAPSAEVEEPKGRSRGRKKRERHKK